MQGRFNHSISWLVAALVIILLACSGQETGKQETPEKEGDVMDIELTSTAFAHNSPIPVKYTCDGEDVSPPLNWTGAPEGTKTIALICDDPDAPMKTWVHWVLYCIPPDTTSLEEGIPGKETLPNGSRHGINDFRRHGYGGPCPPRGKPHRYFFKLYALDTELELKPGARKKDLLKAMEGHIIGKGELIGTYQRK